MPECSLCKHPNMRYYERQILLGKMTIAEAATKLQVPYKTLWHHVKEHTQKPKPSKEITDVATVLREVLTKLRKRVNELLDIPIRSISEREITGQGRLLKDIAMDIAKLEQQLQESPTVQITNLIMSQTKLQNFMIEELCPTCKAKLMKFLEKKEVVTNVRA